MKSNRIRIAIAAALAALSVGAVADSAMAQGIRDNRTGPSGGVLQDSTPKYRIDMSSFRADDESGRDFFGSDEPYWVASSVTGAGTHATHMSRVYGDVDTGETRRFAAADGCVFPKTCGGAATAGAGGIGVSIQLIERDNGNRLSIYRDIASKFSKIGPLDFGSAVQWIRETVTPIDDIISYVGRVLGDDPLGTQTFSFSKGSLERRLTAPGMVMRLSKHFGGLSTSRGADYTLTLRVTRVA